MRPKLEDVLISNASISSLEHLLKDDDLLSLLLVDSKYVAQHFKVNNRGEVTLYRYKCRWWAKLFGEFKTFDFVSFCLHAMSCFIESRDDIDSAQKMKRQKGMFHDWIQAAINERDFDLAVYMLFTYYYNDYRNGIYRKKVLENYRIPDSQVKVVAKRSENIKPDLDPDLLNILPLTVGLARTEDGKMVVMGFDGKLYHFPLMNHTNIIDVSDR